jgi:hypothetical protein
VEFVYIRLRGDGDKILLSGHVFFKIRYRYPTIVGEFGG